MIFTLCCTLMFLGDTSELERIRLTESLRTWDAGTEYVGLSKADIVRKLGKPGDAAKDVWEYWRLHAGPNDVIFIRVVRFKDGKVVSARMELRNVGCVYCVPAERHERAPLVVKGHR